jgi:peptidyl-prolyl cis-trans isomerase A (cyclophilin A)/peptidyl-prolyl cis-trans isomerase B (cyclophilin B)
MLTLCTNANLSLATDGSANGGETLIKIATTAGDITLRLLSDKAPATVDNFLNYVDSGHYDGTVFHRVIPNFMIQGGGFTVELEEKPTGDPVINESQNRLHNIRGTVAMARTSDPDSATAQFFINQRSNLRLDWAPGRPGYTVFAEVVDGMNVVDFIATAPTSRAVATTQTGRAPFDDVPTEAIVIKAVTRL